MNRQLNEVVGNISILSFNDHSGNLIIALILQNLSHMLQVGDPLQGGQRGLPQGAPEGVSGMGSGPQGGPSQGVPEGASGMGSGPPPAVVRVPVPTSPVRPPSEPTASQRMVEQFLCPITHVSR